MPAASRAQSDRAVLTLAHSADADDLVMWWPITGQVRADGGIARPPVLDTGRLAFRAVPDDIERLNRRAQAFAANGDGSRPGGADGYDITVVAPGDVVEAGSFSLRFFGGTHEVIHASIPTIENVGVLVNGALYYPGDSYAVPEDVEVDTLAAPLGAPWLKIGDAMDYVLAVKPRRAFGTHDMTLSVAGKTMHRQRLQWATEQNGGEFTVLEPGDSLDI